MNRFVSDNSAKEVLINERFPRVIIKSPFTVNSLINSNDSRIFVRIFISLTKDYVATNNLCKFTDSTLGKIYKINYNIEYGKDYIIMHRNCNSHDAILTANKCISNEEYVTTHINCYSIDIST